VEHTATLQGRFQPGLFAALIGTNGSRSSSSIRPSGERGLHRRRAGLDEQVLKQG
jgi:hypothetical protein